MNKATYLIVFRINGIALLVVVGSLLGVGENMFLAVGHPRVNLEERTISPTVFCAELISI